MQLIKNASQRPDIYLRGVSHLQDDFRSSIISTLDVFQCFLLEGASVSEVDDFYACFSVFSQHDVLRLEIRVDYVNIWHAQKPQSDQNLPSNDFDEFEIKAAQKIYLALVSNFLGNALRNHQLQQVQL